MIIALAQMNSHIGNFDKNVEKIINWTKKAKKNNADLVVFPELALCGYPPQDLLDRKSFWKKNEESLEYLKKKLPKDIGVIVGSIREKRYNSALFFYDGRVKHQDKTLLPTYDVFDERRYFFPTEEWTVFEFKGKHLFLTVCEDIWDNYSFNPFDRVENYDLLINISASPFEVGKLQKRHKLLKEICKRESCLGIYVNMVGANDEIIFDGTSFAFDENGELLLQSHGFIEEMVYLNTEQQIQPIQKEIHPFDRLEKALVMGISDYFSKTGFKKAVIGLSGGMDSAMVLALASKALGNENVKAILMPGPYSTDHSVTDAKKLCENLKVEYFIIDINPIYEQMLMSLKKIFNNTKKDITEENIQSRIRGNVLMAYSNKFSALVLNTGNKSELSTGYCTLYGDMAGALAVIGDIYKTEVYELARYINKYARFDLIPENIIKKAPSAELAPDQKDEDSLPPYDILDPILYEYLEKNKSAEEISQNYDFSLDLVNDVIHKVFRSEYKRIQAPIVLKVSSKAFGSGRRIPITSKFK